MSGLTKKVIYTDNTLAAILGVTEGEIVSYADISKGVHKYIKEHNLKSPHPAVSPAPPTQPQSQPQTQPQTPAAVSAAVTMKRCKDCGAEIPTEALYCDLCGVAQ
jgi:hypothetical protein